MLKNILEFQTELCPLLTGMLHTSSSYSVRPGEKLSQIFTCISSYCRCAQNVLNSNETTLKQSLALFWHFPLMFTLDKFHIYTLNYNVLFIQVIARHGSLKSLYSKLLFLLPFLNFPPLRKFWPHTSLYLKVLVIKFPPLHWPLAFDHLPSSVILPPNSITLPSLDSDSSFFSAKT